MFKIELSTPTPQIVGKVKAGDLEISIFAGVSETGKADFFIYKDIVYAFTKGNGGYIDVRKTYSVYFSKPSTTQQQLAVFNLSGTTYIVTDGYRPRG